MQMPDKQLNMARLKFGPFGPLIGKLGNTVGYIRKGAAVLRMIPHKSNKPRTVGQKTTTQAFGLAIKFIAKVNHFTNVGFKLAADGTTKTAQNVAVSYTMKHAIKGEYPNQEIDFTKVMVCKGMLEGPVNPVMSYETAGDTIAIKFEWAVDPDADRNRKRDQVMMLAYLPDSKRAFYLDSGARRSAGVDVLEGKFNLVARGSDKKDHFVETYMAFISNDRTQISDSVYMGQIVL
ncbi:hypothetical protein Phep_0444 [Pedobacter heparinus DSM 2366]|uniref:Uncharacterized protein n=2 Tax=Pedobacter heparinus TaxID=984 RepID=C6XZX3_PEDHD|nr:hypothetical protein Phep_0444 [Pedobacter heparinus DSM 2366]